MKWLRRAWTRRHRWKVGEGIADVTLCPPGQSSVADVLPRRPGDDASNAGPDEGQRWLAGRVDYTDAVYPEHLNYEITDYAGRKYTVWLNDLSVSHPWWHALSYLKVHVLRVVPKRSQPVELSEPDLPTGDR